MFLSSPQEYEIPLRPPFELYAAAWWAGAGALTIPLSMVISAPMGIGTVSAGACAVMAGFRAWQGFPKYKARAELGKQDVEFMDLQQVADHMSRDALWLGRGFEWNKTVANIAYEVMRRGPENFLQANKPVKKALKGGALDKKELVGAYWMQNIYEKTENYVRMKGLEGHTLITGTTGSGKTRLLDLILSQQIMRDDGPVICIDPKGDADLRDNMKRACDAIGQPERWAEFNPAKASTSCRIDPCRNWSRPTEIPSRIADMMSGEQSNPFRDIAWNALNTGVQGMIDVGENPSLKKIREFIEHGSGPLLVKVMQAHFARWATDWEQQLALYDSGGSKKGGRGEDEMLTRMIGFYNEKVKPNSPSSTVDGLITLYTHDAAHFQKLIASLIPVLAQLTTDVMGELLSPDYSDPDDPREILDFTKAIRDNRVVYLALDSLSDGTIASATGSIILADLAAVAGAIYNYTGKECPIYLTVDEASEVVNQPMIRILNKGRGAGFVLNIASQTLADYEARLGTKPSALQTLGNLNNIITLRVIDPDTQKFITDQLPTVMIESMQTGYREGTGDFGEVEVSRAGYSEQLATEELPLIPPSLLGMLPDLEYLAKLKDGRVLKGRLPIVHA